MSEWLLKRCERARSAVPDHHEPYVSLHPDTVEAGARLAEAVHKATADNDACPLCHTQWHGSDGEVGHSDDCALADYDRAIEDERRRQQGGR